MEILERRYRVIFEFEDRSGMYPVGTEPIVGGAYLAERQRWTEQLRPLGHSRARHTPPLKQAGCQLPRPIRREF